MNLRDWARPAPIDSLLKPAHGVDEAATGLITEIEGFGSGDGAAAWAPAPAG
jgi:hypothetical protein